MFRLRNINKIDTTMMTIKKNNNSKISISQKDCAVWRLQSNIGSPCVSLRASFFSDNGCLKIPSYSQI